MSVRPGGHRFRHRVMSIAAMATALTIVAACGASTPSDAPNPAAEVFDRFNAMTGEERKTALIAAAQEEGGLVMYTTAPGYDAAVDAFSELYDIEVELFIGRSDTVLQRVAQEYEAGVYQVDVFEDENSRLLEEEGLTYAYINEPLTSQITGYNGTDHMIPFRLSIPVVGWNTDLVSDDEVPVTVEDLADPKWDGRLVLDAGGWPWYAALHGWLTEQGRSEEEIETFFRTVISYSNQQNSSIAMTELLAAGEYQMGTSILSAIVDRNIAVDAPVAWKTADGRYTTPLVVAPEGGTLMNRAPHPATAMLFMDFMLEEGAPLLEERFYPSPIQGAGTLLEGIDQADFLPVDRSVFVDDRERWIAEWDALLQGE
jgi:iron(III) transport system substrate-binding protein